VANFRNPSYPRVPGVFSAPSSAHRRQRSLTSVMPSGPVIQVGLVARTTPCAGSTCGDVKRSASRSPSRDSSWHLCPAGGDETSSSRAGGSGRPADVHAPARVQHRRLHRTARHVDRGSVSCDGARTRWLASLRAGIASACWARRATRSPSPHEELRLARRRRCRPAAAAVVGGSAPSRGQAGGGVLRSPVGGLAASGIDPACVPAADARTARHCVRELAAHACPR